MSDVTLAKAGNKELRKLDTDWAPWKFHVLTWSNGEHYGYPGQNKMIITGQSNFETEEAARRSFNLHGRA